MLLHSYMCSRGAGEPAVLPRRRTGSVAAPANRQCCRAGEPAVVMTGKVSAVRVNHPPADDL